MNNKVVIVGCGNVGMSYAYALINQRTRVDELILIDRTEKKVHGEALDLNHGIPFGPSHMVVRTGAYADCKDAKIVCICAGANQDPGETRLDLITKNMIVFNDILRQIMDSGFNGIFLIATNPVDIMTYYTAKVTQFPANKVIGSGTTLDTARLKYLIGLKTNIDPKDINAYVIGEHGDSEFVPWSLATISLQNIKDFLKEKELEEIYVSVRDAAYEIIDAKGHTCYGIGMMLVRITNAILSNENAILPVSTYDATNDVYIGLPSIIGSTGASRKIYIKLTPEEEVKLQNSINVIKDAMKGANI